MSSSTMVSRLAQAEALGRVQVVAMNEVKFVAFSEKSAIGTRDLAGCSVVIITSIYGAILAHIPPRSVPDTPNMYAGDQNVQRLMEEVGRLYIQRRNYFPETDTYAIFAIYSGNIALPDQKKIIEDSLIHMGLQPFNTILYVTPRDPINQAHGTVFVDSLNRGNQKPVVYSEDRLISNADHPQQHIQETPSPWLWSTKHMRYYKWVLKDGKQQAEWAPPSQ